MSERKYKVPEGGLLAALAAPVDLSRESQTHAILEAFIRWQAENPTVPDDAWLVKCAELCGPKGFFVFPEWMRLHKAFIYEWLARGMYMAHEPEVTWYRKIGDEYIPFMPDAGTIMPGKYIVENVGSPDPEVPEAIKDLLSRFAGTKEDPLIAAMASGHNADVIEAYRRGQKAGTK